MWSGRKVNSVNCGRLMKHHNEITDGIRLISIETSKGIVSDDNINLITNKHKK